MSRALVLPLLVFLAARASATLEPSSVVSGTALSLGHGYRVVARLTFDRRTAAQGGFVYAAPRASPADADAIRLSEAVLTGQSGVLGAAGAIARAHRVPALALPQARWESGALVLRRPVFGPPGPGGARAVERFEERRLAEGEAVGVDPENALLVLFEPAEQPFELELSQALRAFDGLKDLQALLQWYDARSESGPSAASAARLAEEVSARVAGGTATADELKRLRRALEAGLDEAGRKAVAEAAARAASAKTRAAADALDDLAAEAPDTGSRVALNRLQTEAAERAAAATALAEAVGAPALAEPVKQARARVETALRARAKALPEHALRPEQALEAAGAKLSARATFPPSHYERFVADNGLAPTIAQISDDASLPLRRKAERLAAVFASAPAPPGVAAKLPPGETLIVCGPEGCEPPASRDRALDAVKSAWARSWDAEALGRRKRAGEALQPPALTISAAVSSPASGVAHSRDPVSGSTRRLVVQCGADEYTLDRRTLADALPPLIAGASRCLTPEQAAKAARAARALDDALGRQAALTYAFQDGTLFALSWK